MGIGGAPEGVLSAAALKCLGGEIQARFKWRSDEEKERARRMGVDVDDTERVYTTNDLASGDNVVFCATGVTDGELLRGVRFFGGGARTHSLMLSYAGRAGPVHRHRPHVGSGQPAQGPPLAGTSRSGPSYAASGRSAVSGGALGCIGPAQSAPGGGLHGRSQSNQERPRSRDRSAGLVVRATRWR